LSVTQGIITPVLKAAPWLPRTEGSVRLGLVRRGAATRVEVLHQLGAARVRFPRAAAGEPLEAVILNTAGGLTGGDRFIISAALGVGASAVMTTAAAEKIYRSDHGRTEMSVALSLEGNAALAWLPQPTIVFDRAALERTTTIELSAEATFLGVEMLIFGRAAMGESVTRGAVRDSWRLRRDGELVFADSFRLEGPIAAALARPALLAGARASGLVIYAAPDAGAAIERARASIGAAAGLVGVSTVNDLVLARAVAADGRTLQADLALLIGSLLRRPLPRIWKC